MFNSRPLLVWKEGIIYKMNVDEQLNVAHNSIFHTVYTIVLSYQAICKM